MPDRLYLATRRPPSRQDRFWAHMAEFLSVCLGLTLGVLVSFAGIAPEFNPAPSLHDLPNYQAWLVGVFLLVGSSLWLFSILHRFSDLNTLWRVQRVGMGFNGLGWSGYGLAALMARPEWVVPWTVALFMALTAWGGIRLTILHERRIRGAVNDHRSTVRKGGPLAAVLGRKA